MGLKFNQTAGEAEKSKLDYYKYEDGVNKFRLIGDVLPRYVYWKKSADGQFTSAVECLAFDRNAEKFNNIEKDWFSHYFPDEKCRWAYSMLCIAWDQQDNPSIKVLPLKKKMFQQILQLAQKPQFGDPTDIDEGWNCVVVRTKTGPQVFNVEYTVDQLECLEQKRALTDEEKELVKNHPTIDELIPRPTADEQKAFIENSLIGDGDDDDEEAIEELEG